jgi:hypothetical protein
VVSSYHTVYSSPAIRSIQQHEPRNRRRTSPTRVERNAALPIVLPIVETHDHQEQTLDFAGEAQTTHAVWTGFQPVGTSPHALHERFYVLRLALDMASHAHAPALNGLFALAV